MNLIPAEYQNERILTTEQLAMAYGTEVTNLKTNHSTNKDKFIEGKHYFKLEGAELRAFKNSVSNSDLVDKRAPSLMLWTKRGASRHCKMLGTDKAWEQFDILEENYFEPKNKVICLEDMMIAQLKQMKDIRLKQEQLTATQIKQSVQIKEIAAKIKNVPSDHYSIAGYASLRGVRVDVNKARILGCKAAKLSHASGYDVGKVTDPRFGQVNIYHLDILKEVFGSK